jgi:hypothetical protein
MGLGRVRQGQVGGRQEGRQGRHPRRLAPKKRATELGLSGYSGLTKDELIKELRNH